MSTIIAVYRNGRCIGLCGGLCYDAKQPSDLKECRRDACICICGGANHGVGLAKAMDNRNRQIGLTAEHIAEFAKIKGFACEELVVVDRLHPDYRTAHRGMRLVRRVIAADPVGKDDLFNGLGGTGLRTGGGNPDHPGGTSPIRRVVGGGATASPPRDSSG